jgi:hypothetical protein
MPDRPTITAAWKPGVWMDGVFVACVCPDDGSQCLGDPSGDIDKMTCRACLELDPEAPCLNEPEGSV